MPGPQAEGSNSARGDQGWPGLSFFFEKKNQKTSVSWRPADGLRRDAKLEESLFASFSSEKEDHQSKGIQRLIGLWMTPPVTWSSASSDSAAAPGGDSAPTA